MSDANDTAYAQARAQAQSIAALVGALGCDYGRLEELREDQERHDIQADGVGPLWAEANPEDAQELADLIEQANGCKDEDEAQDAIYEDALSVEVRSGWATPGETLEPDEYRIVVCTGGPHVQIQGELRDGRPHSARLLYQDWGTPLTEFVGLGWPGKYVLITYAEQFFPD